MEEVLHVPTGFAVFRDFMHFFCVVFSKQLHADHSKDEHDDGQHQRQVSQSPHGITNYFDQCVESRPRFSQLEYSQL